MNVTIQTGWTLLVGASLLMLAVAGMVILAVAFQNLGRRDVTREVMDQGGGVLQFFKGELSGTDHEAEPHIGRGLHIWIDKKGQLRARKKSQAV